MGEPSVRESRRRKARAVSGLPEEARLDRSETARREERCERGEQPMPTPGKGIDSAALDDLRQFSGRRRHSTAQRACADPRRRWRRCLRDAVHRAAPTGRTRRSRQHRCAVRWSSHVACWYSAQRCPVPVALPIAAAVARVRRPGGRRRRGAAAVARRQMLPSGRERAHRPRHIAAGWRRPGEIPDVGVPELCSPAAEKDGAVADSRPLRRAHRHGRLGRRCLGSGSRTSLRRRAVQRAASERRAGPRLDELRTVVSPVSWRRQNDARGEDALCRRRARHSAKARLSRDTGRSGSGRSAR